MIRLTVIVLLGLLSGFALAQLPNARFELLSNKDGLPSNTVNRVAEDSSGFMWFGTRKYLTRYDGYTFKNLNTNWVNGVAIDRTGRVYASTNRAGQLIRVDSATNAPVTLWAHQEGGAYNTFVDSFGDVWFSNTESICRYEPATRTKHVYPMRKTTWVFHKGSFAEDKNRTVWVMGMETGLFRYDRKADKLLCEFGLDNPRTEINTLLNPLWGGFFDQKGHLWVANDQAGILQYNPRTKQMKQFKQLEGNCFSICAGIDETGRPLIWTGGNKGIAVFRPETETFHEFTNVLPLPFVVQHIYRSPRSGIVWFSTTEGLLRYNPRNQAVQTNLFQPGVPTSGEIVRPAIVNGFLIDRTDPTGQTVWILVAYHGILRWNRRSNTTRLFRFPGYGVALEAMWIMQDAQNRIWAGGNQWENGPDLKTDASDNRFEGIYYVDTRTEQLKPASFDVHHRFFSVPFYSLGLCDRRGRFWIANHYEGVHAINHQTNTELPLWNKASHDSLMANGNWVMTIHEDRRGRIWLGTNQGLFYFDEPSRRLVNTHIVFKSSNSILNIADDQAGNLWLSGWHLLAKVNSQGKLLGEWSEKDGLYDAECRRVAVDAKNRIWVGTYDGLHLFDEQKNTFRRFTVNDGLLSNSTMSALQMSTGNDLLVGSLGGWNTVNVQTIDRQLIDNNPRLTSVRVNNRESLLNWQRGVTLPHTDNAVSFGFSALNFLPAAYNYYAYKLDGFDKAWIDAEHNPQASYTNLPPGSYVFRVRVANEFDRRNSRSMAVPFTIEPAFYQTWSFRLLLAAAVVIALVVVYLVSQRYRLLQSKFETEEAKRQQKEAELETQQATFQERISHLEISALRAQMNPHFIFNCLNSIQYFTAQNDAETASDYLSKFSRLIRLVLENSRSERVTLANELETLQLYIEMEAMRFQQKVNYTITVEQRVDVDMIQIPPLLIQPFVENAIWHGLMHKPEGGTVSVGVQQPNDHLLRVEITDDGIGRVKAAEYKSKSATRNKSFGMRLTAERIELINQLYDTHNQVKILDLMAANGEAVGTKVIVEIPL